MDAASMTLDTPKIPETPENAPEPRSGARRTFDVPVPGIPVVAPERTPLPGQKLVGYEMVPCAGSPEGPASCTCCGARFHSSPRPTRMNARGWLATATGALLCFPLACVPCFMSCSYDAVQQRPVYA